MRIIVKESQYNKILLKENNDIKVQDQWATYLFDRLYPYMDSKHSEKNVVESNLSKTLNKVNFYNQLPINKIIVNTVLGESKKHSYSIDVEDNVIKELEIDFMVTENKPLKKEDIVEVFKGVIAEQNTGITYENKGVELTINELDLLNEVLMVDTVYWNMMDGKNIHVEAAGEWEVDGLPEVLDVVDNTQAYSFLLISEENVSDAKKEGKWDDIIKYLENNLDSLVKVEENIFGYGGTYFLFFSSKVKSQKSIEKFVDLETDDKEISGSGGKKIVDIENELLFLPNPNSSKFGMRDPIKSLCDQGKKRYCKRHMHYGQDYGAGGGAKKGTKILLFKPGKVTKKGCECLTIKHDDGTKSRYCHLDEKMVGKGDRIEAGTFIGTVGGKGSSCKTEYDIHLHLEYYENGTRVDPVDFGKKYIRFLDKDKDYENVKI